MPVNAVNPARAGMIRLRPVKNVGAASKPRASGDDPLEAALVSGGMG